MSKNGKRFHNNRRERLNNNVFGNFGGFKNNMGKNAAAVAIVSIFAGVAIKALEVLKWDGGCKLNCVSKE